jgi:hypothetical protein
MKRWSLIAAVMASLAGAAHADTNQPGGYWLRSGTTIYQLPNNFVEISTLTIDGRLRVSNVVFPDMTVLLSTAGLGGMSYLNSLLDVSTSGLTTDSVLKWNGTQWVVGVDNDTDTVGATKMSDLTDVGILGVANRDFLRYDVTTSKWRGGPLDITDLPLDGYSDTYVNVAGDYMTGQLTTASTVTVQGNALSVGGSTMAVVNGRLGVGTASPSALTHFRQPAGTGSGTFIWETSDFTGNYETNWNIWQNGSDAGMGIDWRHYSSLLGGSINVARGVKIRGPGGNFFAVNGKGIGINTETSLSALSVGGGAVIGSHYNTGSFSTIPSSAPDNGLIVEGPAGFGTPAPSPLAQAQVVGASTQTWAFTAGNSTSAPFGLAVTTTNIVDVQSVRFPDGTISTTAVSATGGVALLDSSNTFTGENIFTSTSGPTFLGKVSFGTTTISDKAINVEGDIQVKNGGQYLSKSVYGFRRALGYIDGSDRWVLADSTYPVIFNFQNDSTGKMGIGTFFPRSRMEIDKGTLTISGGGIVLTTAAAGVDLADGSYIKNGYLYVKDGLSVGSSTVPSGVQVLVTTTGATVTLCFQTSTTGNTNGDGMCFQLDANGFLQIMRESRYQAWYTSGVERMRLLSGGNFGFKETNPIYAVSLASGVYAAYGTGAGFYTNGTSTASVFFGSGAGLTNIPAASISAGSLGASVMAASVTAQAFQAALSAGSNITLTNTSNGVQIAASGAGGGGSSTLATATGTSSGFNGTVSTPTPVLLLDSRQFIGSVQGGGTAYFRIDTSSITALGPNPPAASIAAGSLGSGVQISSISVNALASNSAWRSALGLAIGSDVQGFDATLADLAAAPLTEDNSIDPTAVGPGTLPTDVMVSSISQSAFYSNATIRSNLGLAIGTDVQGFDATLADLAAAPLTEDNSIDPTAVGPGTLPADVIVSSIGINTVKISALSMNGVKTSTTVLYGDGRWDGVTVAGDNMGNDTATGPVNMNGYAIYGTSSIAMTGSGNAVIFSTNAVEIQTGVSASTITFSTGGVQLPEITAPGTPPSGMGRVYVKSSDSKLYFLNDGGTEYDLTAAAAGAGGWTVVNSTSYATNDIVIGTSASQGIKFRAVQQTTGAVVQSLETSTGAASTEFVTWKTAQGAVTTTDASTAAVWSVTVPTNSAVNLHAHIAAMRVGGSAGDASDAASYDMRTAVKNSTSGAVTFVGGASSYQDILAYESTPTWNAYFSTTSGAVEIDVKGLANNTVKWFASVDYLTISSNVAVAGGGGGGSLTFDTAAYNSATSGTTINVGNITTTSNSNRLFLYLISNRRNASQNVSTILFNQSTATYVDDGNGTFIHAEVWQSTVTASVVAKATVTYSAALAASGVTAISLYNVNASSAIRSYANTDSDSATSISQTLPTQSGDACFALYVRSTPTTLTAAAGEGVLVNQDVGTEFTNLVSSRAATSTSTTMSASWTGANRIRMEMICIKP